MLNSSRLLFNGNCPHHYVTPVVVPDITCTFNCPILLTPFQRQVHPSIKLVCDICTLMVETFEINIQCQYNSN